MEIHKLLEEEKNYLRGSRLSETAIFHQIVTTFQNTRVNQPNFSGERSPSEDHSRSVEINGKRNLVFSLKHGVNAWKNRALHRAFSTWAIHSSKISFANKLAEVENSLTSSEKAKAESNRNALKLKKIIREKASCDSAISEQVDVIDKLTEEKKKLQDELIACVGTIRNLQRENATLVYQVRNLTNKQSKMNGSTAVDAPSDDGMV
mmetsp:Transcript_1005/g.1482  ORF Transcript_1005/g.1482 Transcript_1005/m.1482 type:complete len:206 (+) Transcript_1005:144-761(+)